MIKVPKPMVQYTDFHGKSPEKCGNCSHLLTWTTCEVVLGKINVLGWCNRWKKDTEE